MSYLSFNQRDPANLDRPHPILSDPDVRAAIVKALDRRAMVEATFGPWAAVPEGPVPQLSWIRDPAFRPAPADPAGARALLRARGWIDTDGDGILDKDGKPLALGLNFPGQSAPRGQMALQVQEQLRQVGIRIDLNRLDFPVWSERRDRGNFDIDFANATMDPSPAGLVQSWSCAGRGGANKAYYCDPTVDSLLAQALRAPRKEALDAVPPGRPDHRRRRPRRLPLRPHDADGGVRSNSPRRARPRGALVGALAMEPGTQPLT